MSHRNRITEPLDPCDCERATDEENHETHRQMLHEICRLRDDLEFYKGQYREVMAENKLLRETNAILRSHRDATQAECGR